jgi:hypothetical protein
VRPTQDLEEFLTAAERKRRNTEEARAIKAAEKARKAAQKEAEKAEKARAKWVQWPLPFCWQIHIWGPCGPTMPGAGRRE